MSIRLVFLVMVGAAAAGLLYVLPQQRRGSATNIYNGIDAPELPPDASPDEVLDAGVEYSFPASDPISIESAYRHAARRERPKAP